MSLLTACQNVVNETGLGDAPATIISNTDKLAVQLFALAQREAKVQATKNWQRILREQTITTVNGTEGYSLPSDFARYVSGTFWDATNYWPMRGEIDPPTWQALKRGIVSASIRRKFRIRGNQVLVYPTPTVNGDSLINEYARNTPWVDSVGTTYRAIPTADTDTPLFPEALLELGLKWRFKKEKGLDYSEDYNEWERQTAMLFAQDTPAPALDFSASDRMQWVTNVPQQIPT